MFAFVVDICASAAHGVGGDEAEFTDADAGGGYGLQDQGKAVLSGAFCGLDETLVLCVGEFFVFVAEVGTLDFQGLNEKVTALMVFEVAVDSGEQGVDGGGRIPLDELLFPSDEQGLLQGAAGCTA